MNNSFKKEKEKTREKYMTIKYIKIPYIIVIIVKCPMLSFFLVAQTEQTEIHYYKKFYK